MKILGVDPGIRGGLAIVLVNSGNGAQLIDAIDIPTVGMAAKERVDVTALRQWVLSHQPDHCLIERTQAMPKRGRVPDLSTVVRSARSRRRLSAARCR